MATDTDLARRIAQDIKASRWARPAETTGTDVNAYTSPGTYSITRVGAANRPHPANGQLEVMNVGGVLTQRWTTLETEPRVFVRTSTAGAWTAWLPLRWYAGWINGTADLNTQLTVGMFEVSAGTVLNKPTPGLGVLEVFKVSAGNVLHRFTSYEAAPRTFTRMRASAVWGEWTELPGMGHINALHTRIDGLPTGEESVFAPTRADTGTWTPVATPANQANYVTALSRDRLTGWNGNSTGLLKRTRDLGATWENVNTFASSLSWVREMDNGELLVCVGVDPQPRELWLSNGYPTAGTAATWSKVLTAAAPSVTFSASYGFGMHKNIVLINEYGPKFSTTSSTVAAGQNARYTYLSLDHGKTWTTILDINAWAQARGKADTAGIHPHGVAWDPYWDRIWYTYGDDVNGTAYSDDLGKTWHAAYHGPASNSPFQVVGILPMPKAILFGTDTAPNGVQRINRTEGKRTGTYPIEQAYTVPGDDGVTRTHLCHVYYRVHREGGDGPAVFGFSAESTAAASFIVTTRDGYDFDLLWQDAQVQAAGKGIRSVVGPTLTGELIVGSDDQRTASNWTVWRGPVPIY